MPRLALGEVSQAESGRQRAQDTPSSHGQQAGLQSWHEAYPGLVLQLSEWLPKWEQ